MRPRKRLGQRFLVDPRVASRHVEYAQVGPSDVVLEIGPGLGILTREIMTRTRRVIAIERDPRLAEHLRKMMTEVDVIEGDALDIEWPAFDVMASNLPFQISSPLTFRLLDKPFDRAVLMYQWEFARRLVAKPGHPDYSRLSVGVYRRASCEILERVPRNAFHPQPRVDAALVRLQPRPCPFPLPDPRTFDAVVDALFEHRRKTVENGLRLAWEEFAPSRDAFEGRLLHVPFLPQRVEELSPEEIGRIAEALRGPKG